MAAGGQQQFTAEATFSDGSKGAVPVQWSATGGTISAAGLFLAGPAAGNYSVTATDAASGKAGTSSVAIVIQPPPGGNYVPWLKRDWSAIRDKAAAQALGFAVEGSPLQCNVPPDQTWDLKPDPLFGKVIRYYGDPAFNKPGFTVGCTAIHQVSLGNGPQTLWVRQYIKFSSSWTPLPGTGYKAMFLRFQVNGRQQIEVSPVSFYNRTDAPNAGGNFLYRDPAPRCPGFNFPSDRGIPFGMFRLTWDCATERAISIGGDEQWWEFVMGYLPRGNTLTSVWAYRLHTDHGLVNPGPWTIDVRQTTGGAWPLLGKYEMGVNRNSIYEAVMHIDWGPYELVDASRYPNPYNLPGVP